MNSMSIKFFSTAGLIMALSAGGVAPPPSPSAQIPAELIQDCAQKGGEILRNGFGIPICQTVNADGGQSCQNNEDCEGFCLSESQTCTPHTPYFGCYSVLIETGKSADICVD